MSTFNKKLAAILFESDIKSNRLRPATIVMKHGTVIEADHARILKTIGKWSGEEMSILLVGIGPGRFKQGPIRSNRTLSQSGIVAKARDFCMKDEWVRTDELYEEMMNDIMHAEESGETLEEHGYCATKLQIRTRKFSKILTINPENVERIDWK